MRISHTIEHCWAKGGGLEGQQPTVPGNPQPRTSLVRDSGKNNDRKVAVLIAYDHATVVEHDCTHSTEWMVDSSMSSHICVNQNWFTSYSSLIPPHLIILVDKHPVYVVYTFLPFKP